jgi:basic membrane protein A
MEPAFDAAPLGPENPGRRAGVGVERVVVPWEMEGEFMRKVFRAFAPPLVVLALVAAACSNNSTSSAGSAAPQCNSDIKVGLALDVGGLGDKSFNDSAYTGLQKAIQDGLVCEENTKYLEANATGSNRGENVTNLAEAGYDLIVGVGFAFSPDINEIAKDYLNQSFAVIDGYATCGVACGLTNDAAAIPNVADLTFTEEQGSFLVGAAAALEAKKLNDCKTVGFLGGQTGPLIGKFEAGYTAGVHEVNPDIKVLVQYIGDDVTAFNDATKGEALSTGMYNDGACIIYHAAGASGAGLFNAAVKADKLAIGVDSDQYLTASPEQQPLILTSMIKRVDVAVYNAIKDVGDDNFKGGSTVFDLAHGGLDYSKSNTELMTQDIIDQLEKYRQEFLDGTIEVPTKP